MWQTWIVRLVRSTARWLALRKSKQQRPAVWTLRRGQSVRCILSGLAFGRLREQVKGGRFKRAQHVSWPADGRDACEPCEVLRAQKGTAGVLRSATGRMTSREAQVKSG